MRVRLRVFGQVVWEFRWAAIFAAGWTWLMWKYGPVPEGGWTPFAFVTTYLPAVVFLGWFNDQVMRVLLQARADADFHQITTRLRQLLSDLEAKTANLNGHITGGDSYPYLKVQPTAANPFDPAFVTVIGKFTLREVTVEIHQTAPFLVNFGIYNIGTVAFGHRRPLRDRQLDFSGLNACSLRLGFEALNGGFTQLLHLQKVNGEWRVATVLAGHGKLAHAKVDPDFPNPPNWIREIELAGVELGGKPYNPLD